MAKLVSKGLEKRIRKGAKSIERSIGDMRPGNSSRSAAKVAGVAGAAVAGAAGVAAAVHMLRKNALNGATLHVRQDGDHEWIIAADGTDKPLGTFETKREAVKAARAKAQSAAPIDLVIHRSDGSVQESHSYETA